MERFWKFRQYVFELDFAFYISVVQQLFIFRYAAHYVYLSFSINNVALVRLQTILDIFRR